MRVLSLSVLCLSLAWGACDAPEPPTPAQEPKPTAVEVIKPVESPDATTQDAAALRPPQFEPPKLEAKMPHKYMWRWISAKAQSSYMAKLHETFVKDGTLKLTTSTSDGLTLRLEPDESSARAGWTTQLAEPMVPDGQLVRYSQEQALVVAYSRISSGGQLIAVNLQDGKILWRQHLKALGAVNHSQYMNEVQLYVEQERVIIHGMESGGCYTELRSARDGAFIDAERVDCELVKPPAQWPQPSKDEPKAKVSLRVDSKTVASLDAVGSRFNVKVFELYSKGANSWSARLNADHATYGILASDQDQIYVAKAHRIAAGAQVLAFDRRDGAQRWSSDLFGVGPIGHSKYSNLLQTLTVTPRGVELYAVESGCSYLEVLDPKTGRGLINHRYYTY